MPLVRRLSVLAAALAAAALWSGGAFAATAPSNTVPPQITYDRVDVGETLSVWNGLWAGDVPMSFTYQWQACDATGANCADIPGATGSTYTLTNADRTFTFKVTVTATNATGSASMPAGPTVWVPAFTLGTTHFLVHYQSNVNTSDAITETQAGDVAALAERAYAIETGAGYATPPSDAPHGGDNRIDIYVRTQPQGVGGVTVPDSLGPTGSTFIELDSKGGLNQFVVAHELFHVLQIGIWHDPAATDGWLLEGSAEWMGNRIDGFSRLDVGNWDMALDCRDAFGTNQCDFDDYKNNGYSRWPFFEYLYEKYGDSFLQSVLASAQGGAGSATAAISSVLATKGTTLGAAYQDFIAHVLSGNFTPLPLAAVQPAPYSTIATGTLKGLNQKTLLGAPLVTTGPVGPVTIDVDHLSTRFVAFARGGSVDDGPCFAATLTISVTIPSGVTTQPYFWWSQQGTDGSKQPVQPLTVSGQTATLTVPWDTCDWGSTQGLLALPNPTTTLDGQDFKVSGSITIDPKTVATATIPPTAVSMPGTVVSSPSADGVPDIEVFGPATIHVDGNDTQLVLPVGSSGAGKVAVTLGSVSLGTYSIRSGTNTLRVQLPSTAEQTLTSAGAGGAKLTLTPQSPAGSAGDAITRTVVLDPTTTATTASKSKSHSKTKTNSKAKAKRHVVKRRALKRR
jgi:hypothetical protein